MWDYGLIKNFDFFVYDVVLLYDEMVCLGVVFFVLLVIYFVFWGNGVFFIEVYFVMFDGVKIVFVLLSGLF